MNHHINLCQLGCGYWGPNLLRNFLKIDEVDSITVCDTNNTIIEKIQTSFPSVITSKETESYINSEKIDALIISLPAKDHYQYAKKGLLANKHVFVEKPLAMNTSEAEDLIQIADEKSKILMVGHTFLYNNAVRKIKTFIDNGDLGDIYYIFSQRLNLGRVRQDINAMWNLAPHDISIINYWLNEDPINVFAKGVSFLQKGIEDLVFIHMDYHSGKSAHIHVTWLDPLKTRKMIVVGSKKMLVYDDVSTDCKITIYDKGIDKTLKNNLKYEIYDYASFQLKNRTGDIFIPKIDFIEPLSIECQHFIDCISKNQKPITDGISGLHVVKVLEQAQKHLDQQ